MKRIILTVFLLIIIVIPVSAEEFRAPTVPSIGEKYMPEEITTFSQDLAHILKSAVADLMPSLSEASAVCLRVIAAIMLVSIVQTVQATPNVVLSVVSTAVVGVLLLQTTSTLIHLATDTIDEISEYGKLLLPILTGALAAQGGVSASGGIYVIATAFCSVLTTLVSKLLVPMLFVFLCISLVGCATEEPLLQNIKDFLKWLITWSMKTLLYIFTGFLTVTGVVSGTADASALKAARLTISGFVPVIGGILSDASEAVLVGAELMKNATGVYGMLAVIAVGIGPFLKIGAQYILVKTTAGICSVFSKKGAVPLVADFSTAMGFALAMVGTLCIMLLVSIVCIMKGVS